MPERNRRFLLCERPSGRIGPNTFELSEEAVPEISDGEALVRIEAVIEGFEHLPTAIHMLFVGKLMEKTSA